MVVEKIDEKKYSEAVEPSSFNESDLLKELESIKEELAELLGDAPTWFCAEMYAKIKCSTDEVEAKLPQYTMDDIKDSMLFLYKWYDGIGEIVSEDYKDFLDMITKNPKDLSKVLSKLLLNKETYYYDQRQLLYKIESYFSPSKYMKLAEYDKDTDTIIIYTTAINKIYGATSSAKVPMQEYKRILAHEAFIAGLYENYELVSDWTTPYDERTIVFESLAKLYEMYYLYPSDLDKWFPKEYYDDANHLPYAGAFPLYLIFMCAPIDLCIDCEELLNIFLGVNWVPRDEKMVQIYNMYVTYCDIYGLKDKW